MESNQRVFFFFAAAAAAPPSSLFTGGLHKHKGCCSTSTSPVHSTRATRPPITLTRNNKESVSMLSLRIPLVLALISSALVNTSPAFYAKNDEHEIERALRELEEIDINEVIKILIEVKAIGRKSKALTLPVDPEKAMEDQLEDEEQLQSLRTSDEAGLRFKRFTMNFNGMEVSYPTYVKLVRLQEKVMKLRRMIQLLHLRYEETELEHLPEYKRLITLYNTLRPLLPIKDEAIDSIEQDDRTDNENEEDMGKRAFIVNFMGTNVTYPDYVKLMNLQERVIRLDMVIRRMKSQVPLERLEKIPKWHTLLALHAKLKKILPPEYLERYGEKAEKPDLGNLAARRRRSIKFKDDVYVTIGQYSRLRALQQKAMKLDKMMRALVDRVGLDQLENTEPWHDLVELRNSLDKIMPEGHPGFDFGGTNLSKRMLTTDFNGMSVSIPEYSRLMNLRRKVQKLDLLMLKLAQISEKKELESLPQWQKLKALRQSLQVLMPNEENLDDSQ